MKWIVSFLFATSVCFCHELLILSSAIIDYIVFIDDEDLEKIPGGLYGSFIIDLETFQKLTSQYHQKSPGGSGVNTAKAIAHLGRGCGLLGKCGNDADGKACIEALRENGITPYFQTFDSPTGRVCCLISPDGRRTMRAYFGKVSDATPIALDRELFLEAKLIHIEGYAIRNPAFLQEVMQLAKDTETLVSMDMGSKELVSEYCDNLLELIENYIDIIFANAEEAFTLTSLSPEEASISLSRKCPVVVVTDGKNGGYVAKCGCSERYYPFPATLVDDTGAGDFFIGGFLDAYLEGKALIDCAGQGAQVASKIITVIGTELSEIGNNHQVWIDLVSEDTSDGIEGGSSG